MCSSERSTHYLIRRIKQGTSLTIFWFDVAVEGDHVGGRQMAVGNAFEHHIIKNRVLLVPVSLCPLWNLVVCTHFRPNRAYIYIYTHTHIYAILYIYICIYMYIYIHKVKSWGSRYCSSFVRSMALRSENRLAWIHRGLGKHSAVGIIFFWWCNYCSKPRVSDDIFFIPGRSFSGVGLQWRRQSAVHGTGVDLS